jgi:secreted trypsin-like serine protease
MNRIVCVLVFAAAALGQSTENHKRKLIFKLSALPQRLENMYSDHRIVDGSFAPQGKYPSMVSLWMHFLHHCGGTILNANWVLTAASCVKG